MNWLDIVLIVGLALATLMGVWRGIISMVIPLAGIIVGMITYMLIVVPVLTLTIIGVWKLSDGYGIAVAITFVITGLYVTEKFACHNN